MPSRRLILAAIGALPAQAWAQAQSQGPKETLTPEAFLRGIYTPYPDHEFKGQPFWQVDRFFAPDLARVIDAARVTDVNADQLGRAFAAAHDTERELSRHGEERFDESRIELLVDRDTARA